MLDAALFSSEPILFRPDPMPSIRSEGIAAAALPKAFTPDSAPLNIVPIALGKFSRPADEADAEYRFWLRKSKI